MLALFQTSQDSSELFLPSSKMVPVPAEVLEEAPADKVFGQALLWALKANLVSHQEFLEARDCLLDKGEVTLDEPLYV